MPLIDLRTDLKSLKYGQDQLGGGSSGQPYIQTNIERADPGLPLDDGLVRGGIVGAAVASAVDTVRIGKFFLDLPKGPLWIVKQIGLQLSNPRLETNRGLGAITGIASGDFGSLTGGLLQPTRIYNLGLNTLAQVPVNFLGVHFNRHGILPVQDDSTKYLAVADSNNKNTSFVGAGLPTRSTNRLVQKAIDLLPKQNILPSPLSALQTFLSRIPIVSTFIRPQQQMVDQYQAGPGSVYGIGKTFIRRYDYTTPQDPISLGLINRHPRQARGVVNYLNVLGVSNDYLTAPQILSLNNISNNGNTITPPPPPIQYTSNNAVNKYNQLKQKVEKNAATSSIYAFNPFKNTNLGVTAGFASGDQYNGSIVSYTNNPIVYKNGIDAPIVIKLGKTEATWRNANRETRVGSGRRDSINLTPIFSANAGTIGDKLKIGDKNYNINDLVKFRIQALDGDNPSLANYMVFRAYITQLTDNVDATWNDIKYTGRGENFYVYGGFSRKMQVGFKVAALSATEMQPMYQKLNYLMSNLMPDYKDNLMRGPLMRMTIGNWIDGQTCILNSLSYTIPQDSPWEIAINEPGGDKLLILPHIVEVNLSFTPIGSQTRGANLASQKSNAISNIAQNINDYQYITGSIETALPTT